MHNAPSAPTHSSIAALYTYNCRSVSATLIDSEVIGTDCSWTAVYEYTVEDECMNFATNAIVTYTGGDIEAPELINELNDCSTLNLINQNLCDGGLDLPY